MTWLAPFSLCGRDQAVVDATGLGAGNLTGTARFEVDVEPSRQRQNQIDGQVRKLRVRPGICRAQRFEPRAFFSRRFGVIHLDRPQVFGL